MENFYLEKTLKTPKIKLDATSGRLLIAGRSIPENSLDFYKPIFDWLDQYKKLPKNKTLLEVKLDYFNTTSSKCLVEIFRRLEEINQYGSDITINWYYEEDDEDMQESGEDFKQLINLPIKVVTLEDN